MTFVNPYTTLEETLTRLDISLSVTRRALTLGNQDHTTGWYKKTFAETAIKMAIIPKSSQSLLAGMGVYVKADAVGLTRDTVAEGDEIKDASNIYWQVKTVDDRNVGNAFAFRECQLAKLPLR